jgi:hypothetical protein
MTTTHIFPGPRPQDVFGRKVAVRLDAATADLPHHISERLRASRVQAVSKRKLAAMQTASRVTVSGGEAALGFGEPGLWDRIGAVLPLIVLVAGLVAIDFIQNERRANEVAEVDAALLTDDLPPSAYADPGFVQFLKSGGR